MGKQVKISTAIIVSDSHAGFEDRQAHSIATQIIKDVQPTHLIHLGDLLDCYSISRFQKDPTRLDSLQAELNVARNILATFGKAAPNAAKYLLQGNHESRTRKVINGLTNEARELARLDDFQSALQMQSLLKLPALGWKWIPEEKQPIANIIPGILLKHGNVVRRYSGYSAKGEFDALHSSGMSGHTHRGGIYWHTDYNGTHCWIETGCLCKLDAEYISGIANWQQMVTVISWSQDKAYPMQIEQIRIDNGKALYRGKQYVA